MKILIICLTLFFAAGCANSPKKSSPDECFCKKLFDVLKKLEVYDMEGHLCNYPCDCNRDAECHVDDWEDVRTIVFDAVGCTPPCETLENGWHSCSTLEQIWPEIGSAKVRQIIFGGFDINDLFVHTKPKGEWFDCFTVPNEAIPGAIKLLGKAHEDAIKRGLQWDSGIDISLTKMLKIVTDKGTYLIPADWNNKTIYGNNFTSLELRAYLKKKYGGFLEPGEKPAK